MYSVVYPELDFGKFSGMVPESNFGGFSGMVPEVFHVSPEDILVYFDEDPIPSWSKCQNLCYSVSSAKYLVQVAV